MVAASGMVLSLVGVGEGDQRITCPCVYNGHPLSRAEPERLRVRARKVGIADLPLAAGKDDAEAEPMHRPCDRRGIPHGLHEEERLPQHGAQEGGVVPRRGRLDAGLEATGQGLKLSPQPAEPEIDL